jgi:hypothetical protein
MSHYGFTVDNSLQRSGDWNRGRALIPELPAD